MNEVNLILTLYGLFLAVPLVYYVIFVPYALMGDTQSMAKESVGKLVFLIMGNEECAVNATPIKELGWYRDQQAKRPSSDGAA
jgi:hypothetical protein